jgi:hypothetical protein
MKDNFPLFKEVARMLEVTFFAEKLEQLKIATNVEGRCNGTVKIIRAQVQKQSPK